ncbi:nitronate monooxygenase [Agrobacterium vitis]|uniref:Nitronate monooxygenase n=1 Tax=Agrobacterium vitis TaxID=373 RepID=A0A6L6VI43_AGRVI|nr:nitronate monooxygenase [Agrobacterium vitis]MUZ75284.1 nitronate monooxygenase [Agrobacterium vitis]
MLKELGIRFPIIQAPMAGVSTPALAAAVSNAGGLGSLGLGASTVTQARAAIEATQALTDRPFGVNVFCHHPAQRDPELEASWIKHLSPLFAEFGVDSPAELAEIYKSFVGDTEALEMLLDTRPAVVSFHFGLPSPSQISALKNARIRTMATATNLQEAEAISEAGIDAIIAQGIEAGGHRGIFDPQAIDERLSTFVLTRLLVNNFKLPIVAAGGVMDGQGIRATLDLGATAAQLGTAFILSPESAASPGYRANLKSEKAGVTRLTPVLSGRPARGIVNRFIEHCEAVGSPLPVSYPVAYDLAKQLHAAAAKHGLEDFAAHWAGQGAPLTRELPAEELVKVLVAEAML